VPYVLQIVPRLFRLCVRRGGVRGRSPWSTPFPPRAPPLPKQLCSPASQVLWGRPTPRRRTRRSYSLMAFTDRPWSFLAKGVFGVSRFSRMEFPHMHRVFDSAVPTSGSRPIVARRMAFPTSEQGRHTELLISELNTWPACTPVNASPAALPPPAHDSGPRWLAIPSLYGSCIRNSTPVYPGAFSDPSSTPPCYRQSGRSARRRSVAHAVCAGWTASHGSARRLLPPAGPRVKV